MIYKFIWNTIFITLYIFLPFIIMKALDSYPILFQQLVFAFILYGWIYMAFVIIEDWYKEKIEKQDVVEQYKSTKFNRVVTNIILLIAIVGMLLLVVGGWLYQIWSYLSLLW